MATADARPPGTHGNGTDPAAWFVALVASYSLEGVGYIIAGTFLVAAIDQIAPGWVGTGAWILVGLAALPSPALWGWLSHDSQSLGLTADYRILVTRR